GGWAQVIGGPGIIPLPRRRRSARRPAVRALYSWRWPPRHPSSWPAYLLARRCPAAGLAATSATRPARPPTRFPARPAPAAPRRRRRGRGPGKNGAHKPQLLRLLKPGRGLRDGPHGTGERDFAEIDGVGRQGRIGERGDQRRRGGKIGRWLLDPQTASDIE